MEVLDLRTVLADQNIVGEARIVFSETPEFWSAIKSLRGLRKCFHNDLRVQDHIPEVIEILGLAADDDNVGIGVKACGAFTDLRQWTAPNLRILRASAARGPPELRVK